MFRLAACRLAFALSPGLLAKKGKTASRSKSAASSKSNAAKASASLKTKPADTKPSASAEVLPSSSTTSVTKAASAAIKSSPSAPPAELTPIPPVASKPLIPSVDVAVNAEATSGKTLEQLSARHVGTVISFMHRRGYGFLREGLSAVGSAESRSFFFPRSSLDGGFYLAEGQNVAFDVRPNKSPRTVTDRPLKDKTANMDISAEDSKDQLGSDGQSRETFATAVRIRLFDGVRERPVRPIILSGVMEHWDALAGTGVVAELDLNGELHDGAPRFTVALEDLDLSGNEELRRGRHVRFCLESGDRTAARRVIIDRGTERKLRGTSCLRTAADGNNNNSSSSSPSHSRSSSTFGLSGATRFYGTVREIVEGRFGFIILDDSGESIFFHVSNAEGEVKVGDTVSFVLREVTIGRHAGKKTCLMVRRCAARPAGLNAVAGGAAAAVAIAAAGKINKNSEEDDDDDFEFLD